MRMKNQTTKGTKHYTKKHKAYIVGTFIRKQGASIILG